MTICNCWNCLAADGKTGAELRSWMLCAQAEQPAPAELPDATLAVAASTALVTSIGTTGNFVNQDINGLLSSRAWLTLNVSYSFPTSASLYPADYPDPAPTNGFVAATSGIQAAARYAFEIGRAHV